jgi:hypothetical protein
MKRVRAFVALSSVAALGVGLTGGDVVEAAPATVLLDGLSSPKGIDVDAFSAVIVSQGAFGPPGPVLVLLAGEDEPFPVTDPVNLTDVAISDYDGSGWGIGPDPEAANPEEAHILLLRQDPATGEVTTMLDITEYQMDDPDPFDQEGLPTESNPYGLTIDHNGDALVVDAAGNDLIRVPVHGAPSTVARFDVEEVSTSHLPPDAGFPPTLRPDVCHGRARGGHLCRRAQGLPVPSRLLPRVADRSERPQRALLGERPAGRLQDLRQAPDRDPGHRHQPEQQPAVRL